MVHDGCASQVPVHQGLKDAPAPRRLERLFGPRRKERGHRSGVPVLGSRTGLVPPALKSLMDELAEAIPHRPDGALLSHGHRQLHQG
eukprot:10848096-Lingulodinium_polyedra.AAC.1